MIQWLAWSRDVFERAARERRPVLLSITAAWCSACHEMDRTTYDNPDVATLVDRQVVPVRVDSDRRPDINERYNLGGWPTTAFLTPSGELLAGGTSISPDEMRGVLLRVAEAFRARASWPPPAPRPEPDEIAPPDEEALVEEVFRTYDAEHGGFGIEPKFPILAPVHLALALARTRGDERWVHVAERTLDAIADGGLHDRGAGGYFRYATTRDWQLPHRERLLETNASLLGAFVDASVTRRRPADRDRVAELARFILGTMRSPHGGFKGSEAEDVAYLDSSAAAVSALLGAAALLEDSTMARDTLSAFERVLLSCYRPGAGLAHYFDGEPRVRGLLGDQIAAMAALLDTFDLTEDEPYRMMAEELAHSTVRTLWDERGGFRDRMPLADDIGLLTQPERPFVANCDAARVFRRLARDAGEPDFIDRAAGALSAAAAVVTKQGPLAAHYLLAVLEP